VQWLMISAWKRCPLSGLTGKTQGEVFIVPSNHDNSKLTMTFGGLPGIIWRHVRGIPDMLWNLERLDDTALIATHSLFI
jgi:hypothetical protein